MKHHINAHAPFFPRYTGGCILAVCDEATNPDIINTVTDILNASEALLYLLARQDEEQPTALHGVAYLVEIARGLNHSLA